MLQLPSQTLPAAPFPSVHVVAIPLHPLAAGSRVASADSAFALLCQGSASRARFLQARRIVIAESLRIAAALIDIKLAGCSGTVLPGIDSTSVNIRESGMNGFVFGSDLGLLRPNKGAPASPSCLSRARTSGCR